MNRKTDPEDSDFSGERQEQKPWCIDHHNQLQDIWVALRGNGHPENGISYRLVKMEERQSEILDFVKQVKGVFWKALPIALGGALSAIGLFVWRLAQMLIEHGKL